MLNNKKFQSFLYKSLFYLVAFFPLIIIFRSATINIVTVILSIFFLIYVKIIE